jgi:ATP synthase protein I
MTTETLPHTLNQGVRVLGGAALAALAGGLVVVVVAALAADAPALRGALLGVALAVLVFTCGSFVVDQVALRLPAASLLVAVLTYTLQVVLLGLVFWRLTESGALDSDLDGPWLGAALVAATTGWMVGQIVLTTRARIPAYDLPAAPSAGAPTGGDR